MVGWSGRVMRVFRAVAPGVTQWSMLRFFKIAQRHADPAPVIEGSIFAPQPAPHGTDISGGHKSYAPSESGSSGVWLGATLAAGVVAGVYAWWRRGSAAKV
jgi:hypothetical protein